MERDVSIHNRRAPPLAVAVFGPVRVLGLTLLDGSALQHRQRGIQRPEDYHYNDPTRLGPCAPRLRLLLGRHGPAWAAYTDFTGP